MALCATKSISVILKTYIQSSIEQLGVGTVRLRHKGKDAKCRFFLVQGDCPVLIGMLDIKMLNMLKITYEVMGKPH